MTKVLNSTFTEYVSDALTELPHAAAVYVKVGATPLGAFFTQGVTSHTCAPNRFL